ncbi:MAG: S-methyl-5-thioribose-1-phosphate isomerase, partial [Crenarchaeota archaeon]|nr:S-methyl-5-thioribose-1-phosphate isomerase [Thermoproteota archaeon]
MRTMEWQDGTVITIDQTRLPHETVTLKIKTVEEMAEAIKNLRVRGAPLLGAAAAFGLALTACHSKANSKEKLLAELENSSKILKGTRPTAVNLFWAADRVLGKARDFSGTVEGLKTL